jgi:hypothetical protein
MAEVYREGARKTNQLGFKAVTGALRAHGNKNMGENDDDVLAQAIAFGSETDRGAVILATTAFEDKLRAALVRKFKRLSSDERDDLFGLGKPLHSFASKILMAYAVGILDKPRKQIAEVVRIMRNTCAHSGQATSFKDPVLLDAVDFMLQQLGYNGDDIKLRDAPEDRPDWPRFVFLMLIDNLTVSLKKSRSKKPQYSDLFQAYVVYQALEEGWRPPTPRKRRPKESRLDRMMRETEPPR